MTRRAFAALAVSLLAAGLMPAAASGQTTPAGSKPAVHTVVLDLTPGRDIASGLAVKQDGKTVVVGTSNAYSGQSDMAVLRFGLDGELDPTFGNGGKVFVDNGGDESAYAVAVQPDGGIVVVGSAPATNGHQVLQHVAAIRLDSSGRPDPTFNGGNLVILQGITADGQANAVALQPDGRIVLAGSADGLYDSTRRVEDVMVARLNTDGTTDQSFGDGGMVLTNSGGSDVYDEAHFVAVRPNGKIVVGGQMSGVSFSSPANVPLHPLLVQYSASGVADPTFGTGGIVIGPATGTMASAALRPDGTLVTVGDQINPFSGRGTRNVALAAYRPDGSPDPRFGAGGATLTQAPPSAASGGVVFGGNSVGVGIAQDARGGFLVAGAAFGVDGDLAMLRYNGAGALDTSFGRAGWLTTDAGGSDAFTAVATRPGGGIVATGRTGANMDEKFLFVVYPFSGRRSAVESSGWNVVGQVGDGTTVDRPAPTAVTGFAGGEALAGGVVHSLALDDGGSVYGWGSNVVGQLGDGTTQDRLRPVLVPGLHDVAAVAAGYFHSLAVTSGTVEAWGWNAAGQLGDGTVVDRHVPVAVPGLNNVVAVSAGAHHSLALRNDGTVWAWGWNGVGQLGDGTTLERHVPVQVHGQTNVVAVSAGAYHSLALTSDGSVFAWGWNVVGQFGDGTTTDRHEPVRVTNPGMVAIAAGGLHSLALHSDGSVWAWGYNGYGEVGDGTVVTRLLPVRVPGLAQINAIAAGLLHSAAITVDQQVWTWGWNGVGQLGDGTLIDRHSPVLAQLNLPADALAAGAHHTVVLSP